MTQCWVEFRNLCKEASNLDSSVPIKPEIHSFQTMYDKGGGDVVKRVIFAQKYGSSHWPEVKILKVMPILICSPKNMGKKLQNELWARMVISKLSERWPPSLFLGADKEHGQKRGISANYSNANF